MDQDDLVVRAKAGDREAVARLYQRYAPLLEAHCARRADGRVGAEDLAAEVFVRALERLDGHEPRAVPPEVWLLRIAEELLGTAR